jgi:hypothetical protein
MSIFLFLLKKNPSNKISTHDNNNHDSLSSIYFLMKQNEKEPPYLINHF